MGIWLIVYKLADSDADEYLEWFHGEHIPEKLSRPGYDWAAHYRSQSVDGLSWCLAMFGSDTARTFYDPSPAQLKPTQDDLTRKMIGFRGQVQSWIVTEEWAGSPEVRDGQSNPIRAGKQIMQGAVQAPSLSFAVFPNELDTQVLCAWCAQILFPTLTTDCESVYPRKWLASTGATRHLLLLEHQADFSASSLISGIQSGDMYQKAELEITAHRIWPESVA